MENIADTPIEHVEGTIETPVSVHKVYFDEEERSTATPSGDAVMFGNKSAYLLQDELVLNELLKLTRWRYSDPLDIDDHRLVVPVVNIAKASQIAFEICHEYQTRTLSFISQALRQNARKDNHRMGQFKTGETGRWSFREDFLRRYLLERNKVVKQ